MPENAVIIIILAVIAGLAKFCPIPPNSCFTTTMATTLPNAACQSGIVTGRLNASKSPVTTAERSDTVTSRLQSFSNKNSDSTLQPTQTLITNRLRKPKITTDITAAGRRAIITSSIIF